MSPAGLNAALGEAGAVAELVGPGGLEGSGGFLKRRNNRCLWCGRGTPRAPVGFVMWGEAPFSRFKGQFCPLFFDLVINSMALL